MTIFDIITSTEIASYWELMTQDRAPYLGEELFPNEKKLGLKLDWLKGSSGLPIVLKASAFDVKAVPRPRIGFEKMSAQMPFFKESKNIDEELRQQLNMIIETGNQAYIDTISNRIFADETELLEGAAAQRERMRMMMLTTGVISMKSNGQVYEYDYRIPEGHKKTVTKSWSDQTATIMDDIRKAQDIIREDTGVELTRAITTSKVIGYMRNNTEIKKSIAILTDGQGFISDSKVVSYIKDELGITIAVYDKKYKDEDGNTQNYVPEDTFTLIPDGTLGNTWFGTTPEESDLLTSGVANVSIVDTGVAITTVNETDPVNVNTKVTMICLPDFPTADQVFVYDVKVE